MVERVNSDSTVIEPANKDAKPEGKFQATGQGIIQKVAKERSWPVDKILAHRTDKDGQLWLKVDCTGYYASIWEARSSVTEKLVSRNLERMYSDYT